MSDETGDQAALIESARVKFKGMSQDSLDDAPGLDERRTYIVKAQCVEHQHKRMKDGEVRLVATMEIDSIYERGKVPIVDEPQPGLFDADGTTPSGDDEVSDPDDDGDETGGSDETGGEASTDDDDLQGAEWGDRSPDTDPPADPDDDGDHGRPSFSAIDGGQA